MTGKRSIPELQTELNRLYCEGNEMYHDLAVNFGLSDSVMWILYTLNDKKEPCTPTEIGEVCSLSKQTVHSGLQSLEREGYLSITVSKENRKNKLVELTAKGKQLIDGTVAHIVMAEMRAFCGMEQDERQELLRLMEKYLMLLKAEADKLISGQKQV